MEFFSKKAIVSTVVGVVVFIGTLMAGIPQYNVYKKDLAGKAILREATYTRQIAIEEAKAAKDSALLNKETEIIKAEAIAEANRIINESLTTEYLQYKFIETLNSDTVQTIYVPTESNMPLMEAGRSVNK